jgi:phenylpropionate dioxygenase-like ring-hydroxylating dioxygenase large terminal subunit
MERNVNVKPSGLRHAWYPVAQSANLGRNGLVACELFGEPLVCFRDAQGHPVCLQDRCPHRSTPLSLGRVTEGRIECRYHGWQFGEGGRCKRIPVLPANKTPPAGADAFPRACQERHGVIWVWGDGSEGAEPGPFPEHLFETIDAPDMGHYIFEKQMEVPHGSMIENFLDPAHLPFTHHGTMSLRSAAQPFRFEMLEDAHAVFAARAHFPHQPAMVSILKFYAPCAVSLDMGRTRSRMRVYQLHLCVPSARERMVLFSFFACNVLGGVLRIRWAQPLFRWGAGRVVAQDIAMLRGQQRNVDRGAPTLLQPTFTDSLTIRYRKWVKDQLTDADWFQGFDVRAPRALETAGVRPR